MVSGMNRTRRLSLPLATALVAVALTAGPAAASHGGGDGGSQPAPVPQPAVSVDPCEGYWDTSYADDSVAIVNATRGGCVIVRRYPSGVNLLDQVILLPGWTYTVESNGGGTNSRVQIALSNASTGEKAQICVEAGKTIIS
jgi:hypothetical protein